MSFLYSYKRLEKLCGEIMDDDRCVSAYIDEMIKLSRGSIVVKNWDEDLAKLKHYRWVRNQIAHNPDCTESNMCQPGDSEWIDDFYSRIMNQIDPLAKYRKAVNSVQVSKAKPTSTTCSNSTTQNRITNQDTSKPKPTDYKHSTPSQKSGCLPLFIAIAAVIAVLVLALFITK